MSFSHVLPILICVTTSVFLQGCENVDAFLQSLSSDSQTQDGTPNIVVSSGFDVRKYSSVAVYVEDNANHLDRGEGATIEEVKNIFSQALKEKGYAVANLPSNTLKQGYGSETNLAGIAKKNGLDGVFIVGIDSVATSSSSEGTNASYSADLDVSARLLDAHQASIVWSASYVDTSTGNDPMRDASSIPQSITVLTLGITPMPSAAYSNSSSQGSPTLSADYNNSGYELSTVKRAQQNLSAGGYSVGVADGLAGKKTSDAIRQFQSNNNLKVTGALDDRTISLLESMYGSQVSNIHTQSEGAINGIAPAESSTGAGAASFTPGTVTSSASITSGPAEVYDKPSPFGDVLTTLPEGSKVEVIEVKGEWVEIRAGTSVGYLYLDLTSLLN